MQILQGNPLVAGEARRQVIVDGGEAPPGILARVVSDRRGWALLPLNTGPGAAFGPAGGHQASSRPPMGGPTVMTSGIGCSAQPGGSVPARSAAILAK
jgi:hypothetical protein